MIKGALERVKVYRHLAVWMHDICRTGLKIKIKKLDNACILHIDKSMLNMVTLNFIRTIALFSL